MKNVGMLSLVLCPSLGRDYITLSVDFFGRWFFVNPGEFLRKNQHLDGERIRYTFSFDKTKCCVCFPLLDITIYPSFRSQRSWKRYLLWGSLLRKGQLQ